ncbi:hypothetical protein SISSUDRAFT_684915 [Sistotremastrum suecicum HHB10207 ss-3]|uniref:Uncharacterized protein n=1 Tax=Sistotremastrum suecicum HHB10207 ss-3 TaxID=1314776 RepID=A0A166I1Z3_9AGAM|nr:hypothetical protein SISSUDRAFT_684915 [Sistotremastrum suecicum HHB10207 ss-3]
MLALCPCRGRRSSTRMKTPGADRPAPFFQLHSSSPFPASFLGDWRSEMGAINDRQGQRYSPSSDSRRCRIRVDIRIPPNSFLVTNDPVTRPHPHALRSSTRLTSRSACVPQLSSRAPTMSSFVPPPACHQWHDPLRFRFQLFDFPFFFPVLRC